MKKLLTIIILLTLSGCSILQPAKTPNITNFVISCTPKPYPSQNNKRITLLITPPQASALFDSTQILYSDQPYQTRSYAISRWARKPASMIHPLMIHSLQQSRYFHAVIAPPFVGQFDYTLNTRIICMQQIYRAHRGFVKFIAKAEVINQQTGKVIQTKIFTINQPIRYCSVQSGVIATNEAVSNFLRQLTKFTIITIRRNNQQGEHNEQ